MASTDYHHERNIFDPFEEDSNILRPCHGSPPPSQYFAQPLNVTRSRSPVNGCNRKINVPKCKDKIVTGIPLTIFEDLFPQLNAKKPDELFSNKVDSSDTNPVQNMNNDYMLYYENANDIGQTEMDAPLASSSSNFHDIIFTEYGDPYCSLADQYDDSYDDFVSNSYAFNSNFKKEFDGVSFYNEADQLTMISDYDMQDNINDDLDLYSTQSVDMPFVKGEFTELTKHEDDATIYQDEESHFISDFYNHDIPMDDTYPQSISDSFLENKLNDLTSYSNNTLQLTYVPRPSAKDNSRKKYMDLDQCLIKDFDDGMISDIKLLEVATLSSSKKSRKYSSKKNQNDNKFITNTSNKNGKRKRNTTVNSAVNNLSISPKHTLKQKSDIPNNLRGDSQDSINSFVCQEHTGTNGEICGAKFSRTYDLTRHHNTVHSRKKVIFRCLECIKTLGTVGNTKTFSRLDALTRHVKSKHENLTVERQQEVTQFAKQNVGCAY